MRITGKITSNKEPLPFANVYVSDANGILLPSQIGTQTDFDGTYTLSNIDPSGYITVSHVSTGKNVVNVGRLRFVNGTATYNKDYSAASNSVPVVTVTTTRVPKKPVAEEIKMGGMPKWILPTVLGLTVIGASIYAVKKWG